MRRPPLILLALVTCGLGVAGLGPVRARLHEERARLEQAHAQERLRLRESWAQADAAARREWERGAREQRRRWEREVADRRAAERQRLEAALGGPVQVVLKDPELSLTEMIRRVALAVAPDQAQAVVEVDRFTEFDLVVAVASLETRLVLADCARRILDPCAPYLNAVRFVYDTHLLAELNRRELDRVPDWSRATRERVLELFEDAARARAPQPRPPVVP